MAKVGKRIMHLHNLSGKYRIKLRLRTVMSGLSTDISSADAGTYTGRCGSCLYIAGNHLRIDALQVAGSCPQGFR